MRPFAQLLSLLKARRGAPARTLKPNDLSLLAPLGELVEETRPQLGLLSNIEAELDANDAPEDAPNPMRGRWPRLALSFLMGAACVAAILAAIAMSPGQRHGIAVQQSPHQPWLDLGQVSLHGDALQTFVAKKCQKSSHLIIHLSIYEEMEKARAPHQGRDVLGDSLMAPEEKIRMRCIF